MKLFHKAKDGGPESLVTGYWLIEWKPVLSIALLKFEKGSRESYHTHAFNAVSWILKGELLENTLTSGEDIQKTFNPSIIPLWTPRQCFHRVFGIAPVTWALTFRGPWVDKWKEYLPKINKHIILTHGRKEVK